MSRCRSCGAEIAWVRSKTGKPIPTDPDPVRGVFRIVETDKGPVAESQEVYQSHFASCPNADEHRKRR